MTDEMNAAFNAAPDQAPADLLPPDAAARDAARRGEMAEVTDVLLGEDIRFVTKQVSDTERAAVIAVLTQMRAEETARVKRVERREREPWARSQRVPERISDLLIDG
ncbi:hypothetical protein JOF28_002160 [Leucobacter exalbidus]|uniref:Uncharacterized protein n=1 Tax=Leucobacter exalbidus TaxID=662960 RepID=A0A940T4H3_9MICO|nr:hypothetical protein [Leucobacter exalbidus]MBP1326928.1 hypothetical protein [Leucobacter exalbidus]